MVVSLAMVEVAAVEKAWEDLPVDTVVAAGAAEAAGAVAAVSMVEEEAADGVAVAGSNNYFLHL